MNIFRFSFSPGVYSLAMAGFLASFFSSFTLCPTELVKCKLQSMREVAVRLVYLRCHMILEIKFYSL